MGIDQKRRRQTDVAMDQPSNPLFEAEILSSTHSFILKFWLEETSLETKQAVWRGRITHVPSHAQAYVKDLDEVITFINSYIQFVQKDAIKSTPSLTSRIKRLLQCWFS